MSHERFDVVVAGAGPAGIVAALGFAQRGARVLVCEANEAASERLAGEWLHPLGLAALAAVGVSFDAATPGVPGRGFVILPEDDAPIRLPYGAGRIARSLPHASLVAVLRERLRAHPRIDYRTPARVVSEENGRVHLADGRIVVTGLLVGAEGRGSVLRRALASTAPTPTRGRMAGILLEDVELPYEEHGHVILGGPGVALLYRIDARHSRLCLDVPDGLARTPVELWDGFAGVLPHAILRPFRESLEGGSVVWASTRVVRRSVYGAPGVALVGDAVGTVHPLCAAGLTLALGDAHALVDDPDPDRYAARRRGETRVGELLSEALERVLSARDPASLRVREALLSVLRASPDERARTLAVLAGEKTEGRTFAAAFARVGVHALRDALRDEGSGSHRRAELRELLRYARYPLEAARLGARPADDADVSARVDGPSAPCSTGRPSAPPWFALARPRSTTPRFVVGPDGGLRGPDWDFCEDSLRLVSRSFARPIGLLPPRLRVAVTCGYLLCRVADTIEDATGLSFAQRDALFGVMLDVLEARAPATRLSHLAFDLPATPAEHRLATEVHRVLGCVAALPPTHRAILLRWTAEMVRGMRVHSARPAGADGLVAPLGVRDLERYCYFVAGTVGHMLTDLFEHELALDEATVALLRARAESFGIGLQLVNVLKDIHEDRGRGVSYVPRDLPARRGLTLEQLLAPAERARAHEAVAPLFERASRHLDEACEYALLLPAEPPGPRLFCLLPLFMAVRTLAIAKGNDALFDGSRPVKMAREEVETLVEDCLRLHADDRGLCATYTRLAAPPTRRTDDDADRRSA